MFTQYTGTRSKVSYFGSILSCLKSTLLLAHKGNAIGSEEAFLAVSNVLRYWLCEIEAMFEGNHWTRLQYTYTACTDTKVW